MNFLKEKVQLIKIFRDDCHSAEKVQKVGLKCNHFILRRKLTQQSTYGIVFL